MNLDIKTLAFVIALTHFIQMLIFAQQYYANRESKEIKWWLYWSIFENLAFMTILIREAGYESIRAPVIILQNVFMVTGVMFLYAGIVKFYGRKVHRKLLYYSFIFFTAIFIFFTAVEDNILIRSLVINFYMSFFAFLPVYIILKNTNHKKYSATNLILFTFLLHGSFFLTRFILIACGQIDLNNFFENSLINYLTFVEGLAVGIIWTFGFIVLHNEKLSLRLTEVKNKFQSFFEASPDVAIITSAKEGKILEANDNFFAVSGYSREEASGSTTISIKLWKNPADRDKVVNEIKLNKCVNNFETEFVKKNGESFIGLISSSAIEMDNDICIMSIVRDMTESRKLERELLDSAEKWVRTFDGISDAIFLLDADGIIVKYNQATERIIGKGNYIGKHCWEIVHKSGGHIDNCPFIKMKTSLKRESMLLRNNENWFEVTTDPIIQGGILTGAVHIISDITQRKKSEEELNKTLKELKQLNDIMIGREIRMTELKQEINELLKKCGSEPKY